MSQKNFSVFAERFRSLRGDMTQDEFAKLLGLSRPTVGFYENGTRLPDALTIKQIAERCNISADWLLGLTDVTTSDANYHTVSKLTGLSESAIHNILIEKEYYDYTVPLINQNKSEESKNNSCDFPQIYNEYGTSHTQPEAISMINALFESTYISALLYYMSAYCAENSDSNKELPMSTYLLPEPLRYRDVYRMYATDIFSRILDETKDRWREQSINGNTPQEDTNNG